MYNCMKPSSHDHYSKYLFTYVDKMIMDSKEDEIHQKILLDLAELFLKNLLQFYENERFNCLVGYIYQRLGWVKYTK